MKRITLFAVLLGVALGSAALFQNIAHAQAAMTEAHVARIRANCVEAQSSLSQLHQSDALLRVNRGQLYESMSTKLMAPFNGRIALNRLDSANLVSTTADYERQLMQFRENYKSYEEAMSKLLKINCTDQPVAFYDGVGDARSKRQKVHDSTVVLHRTIKNYKTEFEAFAKTVKDEN